MPAIEDTLSDLQALSPSLLIVPSHTSYTSHKALPWSQTTHSSPSAFVSCPSAENLSAVLPILTKHRSRFAARTTGHNPNPGFSSLDGDGVVLDLSGLNGLEILRGEGGKEEVKVGAGCRWGDVYRFVEEKGRSVIGGRDGGVGVGGFLLGGGLGAVPNLHGLGTDNIKAMEMVAADGRLIEVTLKTHPSLFHCLKGGLANFGIVTSFTLSTHGPLHLTWNITLVNPSDHGSIHKATLTVQKSMESDSRIGTFVNFNKDFVAVGLIYTEDAKGVKDEGSKVEHVDAFKAFDGLEKIMSVAEGQTGTIGDLAKAMSHATEEKKRYVGTLTTRPDENLYGEIYRLWQKALEGLPEGAVLHYTIQPVGSQAVRYGQEQGGNAMNLQPEPQVWWVFTAEWPSSLPDDAIKSAVDNLVDEATSSAKERGVLLDYLCASFASGRQDVLGSYGPEMVRKMQEVSAEWDAEGVFQELQNGGFLLRDCGKGQE